MEIEHYYYIYSAMTQATGALIALVGIFIVYRLQAQRDKIEKTRQIICSNVATLYSFSPVKETLKKAKLDMEEKGKSRETLLKPLTDKLETYIKSYHWTIKYGAISIAVTTFLFLFFIAGLYLHSKLPHPLSYFWSSLVASFLAVIYLGIFIYRVLKKEAKEYSTKELEIEQKVIGLILDKKREREVCKVKKIGERIIKYVPILILLATICGLFIMWGDFELTNRPFLEIQPVAFTVDPDGKGDSESEIWSTLHFKFINHGKTPAYEIKVEKLKASLRREIDLVNDIKSKVENLCVFPRSSVDKHTTFTAAKDYALEVIKGTESISLDIKIVYQGPNRWLGLDNYWYVFEGDFKDGEVLITNTDGN